MIHTHLMGGTSGARALLARRTLHSCFGAHAFGSRHGPRAFGIRPALGGALHRHDRKLSSHSCGSHSRALQLTEKGDGALCLAAQTPVQCAAAFPRQVHSQHCAVPGTAAHKLRCSAHTHLLSPQKRPALSCSCPHGVPPRTHMGHSSFTKSIAARFACRGPEGYQVIVLSDTFTNIIQQRHPSCMYDVCSKGACPAADLLGTSQGCVMCCPIAQGKGNSPQHGLGRGLVVLWHHALRCAFMGFLQHDKSDPVGSCPQSCLHVSARPEALGWRACMWRPAISLQAH